MPPLSPPSHQDSRPYHTEPEQLSLFEKDPVFRRQFYAFVQDPENDDYTNAGDETVTAQTSITSSDERGMYIGLLRPLND